MEMFTYFVISLVYAGRSQEDATICIPSYNIFLVPISNILLSCIVTANFCNNISPTILDNMSTKVKNQEKLDSKKLYYYAV